MKRRSFLGLLAAVFITMGLAFGLSACGEHKTQSGDENNSEAMQGLFYQKMAGEEAYQVAGIGQATTSFATPNGVTSIGERAFLGCSGLTSVTIGNGVKEIGYMAFCSCRDLTSVTIGNGVEKIGYMAFDSCLDLTSVTMPKSVTSIGDMAFYGCKKLTKVYYQGEKNDWNKISIGNDNYSLDYATMYYSETKPTAPGNYWHYVNGVPTPWDNA